MITFKVSRTAKGRIIGSIVSLLIVIGIFIVPFIPGAIKKKKAIKARQDRYQTATLLRVRKLYSNANVYDPMWEEAALRLRTEYLISFLGTTYSNYSHGTFSVSRKLNAPKDYATNRKPYTDPIFGYTYVDVKEGGSYVRYTLPWGGGDKIKSPLQGKPSRYAVTYETKVNPNERKYWIASAVIKIIDTKDNSLLAEKTIYVFDHGLGSGVRGTSGRQPWTHAKKCPNDQIKNNEVRFFTEKVLKPKQPNFN